MSAIVPYEHDAAAYPLIRGGASGHYRITIGNLKNGDVTA